MSKLRNWFTKKGQTSPTDSGPSEISGPMNVSRNIHVTRNKETGAIEGLPDAWLRLVQQELT